MSDVTLLHGDCLALLPTLPDASVDCVVSDPPYPEIDRAYGRLTEAEWMALMQGVVTECRRVLKPTGSAVFVLQPNSAKVGSMRLWLWKFLVWAGENWNIVQDAYWWNLNTLPTGGAPALGLLRPSVKPCVWLGRPDCYRNQDAVLWTESNQNRVLRTTGRAWPSQLTDSKSPSGLSAHPQKKRDAAARRGGVTPFNLLPIAAAGRWNAGAMGHGAGTPLELCDWWVRYLCPPGGTVLDPFAGTATVGEAAIKRGCHFIGMERYAPYWPMAERRLATAQPALMGVA